MRNFFSFSCSYRLIFLFATFVLNNHFSLAINNAGLENPVGTRKAYFIHLKSVTFNEAGKGCNEEGHVLASIETPEEQQNLTTFLNSTYPMGAEWWTSGSDNDRNGHFEWTAYGTRFRYTNFVPDFVQNSSDEDCVVFQQPGIGQYLQNDYNYQWALVNCGQRRFYICETILNS